MKVVNVLDRFQRRHRIIGFPLAVIYKYFDDQGPYLAAIIAYYGFIAIFPILLISTSVLGFFLDGDPTLRDRLLESALGQFPIVGDQLGQPEGLSGSTGAIIAGSIAALYGSMGLGQASQNAANIAWAVPRNSRANPFLMRLRSLVFLAIAGLGILVLAGATSVLANIDILGSSDQPLVQWGVRAVVLVLTIGIFVGLFRLVSAGRAGTRAVLPGAVVSALGWQLLQLGGNAYVTGVIGRASQMNQTFALVLGLVAFLFVAAIIAVMGLEVNVVLRRRLYPRALLTPFTDNVQLTRADEKAYTMYAKAQRHKGFQHIEATFDSEWNTIEQPAVPKEPTPADAPPAQPAPSARAAGEGPPTSEKVPGPTSH
ncbi:YihY/virulence factor BrkB family protein [Aeromicrobium sp. CF4.19]|uniref:YihY/virulence factor BrkB family protein n=1 Tax=Aeromicrobium sp. CF4.19 TaxID=3373082 RepID=UPI003EE5BA4C